MAMTTRKNSATKALQSEMARAKKTDSSALLEWLMSCNTNSKRGHVYDQTDFLNLYGRNNWSAPQGATKTCHLKSHTGNEFKYIVVKRHQEGGYIPEIRNEYGTGNQLIDEINCWVRYAEKPESDFLCPILKYFTAKSDRVDPTSEKMQENVVIIAQRAVKVGNARTMCELAQEMNESAGYLGIDADVRYNQLKRFSDSQNWRDAMRNPGNSGVMFDYAQQCFKAVFIDYAL